MGSPTEYHSLCRAKLRLYYWLAMTSLSGEKYQSICIEKPTAERLKNTIDMARLSTVEIDFIDDDPSPNSLHCHHQDHQDKRLMSPVTYP
jgi:FtsP/CotA-like multicopper oxidase with cupredoxin domain